MRVELIAVPAPHSSGDPWMRLILEKFLIAIVSAECFISSVAGKRDRYMLPSETRNVVRGQHGGIAERFFQGTGQGLDCFDYIRLQNEFVMFGRELCRNQTRVGSFIQVCMLKSD